MSDDQNIAGGEEHLPSEAPVVPVQAVATAPATPSRTRGLIAAVALAAATGVGGYVIGASTTDSDASAATTTIAITTTAVPQDTPIESAAKSCGVTANVEDNGATIVFDTRGEEDYSGDSFDDVACVLVELDTPSRVTSAMDSTRALDGTLTDSWDVFQARWNYHPNSGLNLTIWISE